MRSLIASALLVFAVTLSACGGEPDEGNTFGVETDQMVCGDGICVPGESCLSCMFDCGTCVEAPPMCGVGSCDPDSFAPDGTSPTGEGPDDPPAQPDDPQPNDPPPNDPEPNDPQPDDPYEPDPVEPEPVVGGDWPADWIAYEEEMLRLVNEARVNGATCPSGAKPATHALTWNLELAIAARLHSQDMADNGYFSHTSQDGRSPWQRIDDAGYSAGATGENIAAGQNTPQSAFSSWMTSDGHCRNIMSSGSNEIGVGYASGGGGYGSYWTQTFGDR